MARATVFPADWEDSRRRFVLVYLIRLLSLVGSRLWRDRCPRQAAALAYQTVLSLVPLLPPPHEDDERFPGLEAWHPCQGACAVALAIIWEFEGRVPTAALLDAWMTPPPKRAIAHAACNWRA